MSKSILFFGANTRSLIQLRLDLMKDFKKLGYRVIACAPLDIHAEEVKSQLKCLNIEFIAIRLKKTGLNVFSDLIAFIGFYKVLKEIKPEIVYLYYVKPVIYGSIVAKLVRTHKIYSTIAGLGSVFISTNIAIRALRVIIEGLYKMSLRFNTRIFFQNPDDLNLFITRDIIPEDKTLLVNGSGVDLSYYSLASLPKEISFIMVARLIKDKGIHEYISACKALKALYPKITCYLFGSFDTNPTSMSKKELNSLVDEKIVNYIDGTTDVRKALAKANVFVLPSYREGTSRATLEAMAMGRPIITTDVPGCRETVIDGVNGYLVPVKNSAALAKAMERFILHPETIQMMGKESRRIAEEKYDVKKVNKTIIKAM